MLCIEARKRRVIILTCFLAKYPHGRAVIAVVKIAHIKLKVVNMMANATFDLVENACNTGKTACEVMYP